MAIQAAEAQDIESQIAEVAVTTEALARRYFGPHAYLRRDTHIDRDTGEEQTVLEVHYCFPDPEADFDRLAALHNAFTNEFARVTIPEILSRIILMAIPTDDD